MSNLLNFVRYFKKKCEGKYITHRRKLKTILTSRLFTFYIKYGNVVLEKSFQALFHYINLRSRGSRNSLGADWDLVTTH